MHSHMAGARHTRRHTCLAHGRPWMLITSLCSFRPRVQHDFQYHILASHPQSNSMARKLRSSLLGSQLDGKLACDV